MQFREEKEGGRAARDEHRLPKQGPWVCQQRVCGALGRPPLMLWKQQEMNRSCVGLALKCCFLILPRRKRRGQEGEEEEEERGV